MGKRGPAPGSKYLRRVLKAGTVVVVTDGQLIDAQRFCERLDAILEPIERGDYPIVQINPQVREKLREFIEATRHSVLLGIERFYSGGRYADCD